MTEPQLTKNVQSAEIEKRLQKIPTFQGLEPETLSKMAKTLTEGFISLGEQVIAPDESDNDFYIIDQGRVKKEIINSLETPVKVQVLKEDRFFGHFSIIYDVPYGMSIIALAPLYVLKMSKDQFRDLYDNHADFADVFESSVVRKASFVDRLHNFSVFSGMTKAELEQIANHINVELLPEGTDLLEAKQGQAELVVLGSGEIQAIRQQSAHIKNIELHRCSFLSYLSEMEDTEITVTKDAMIYTLDAAGVEEMIATNPRMESFLRHEDMLTELNNIKLFKHLGPEDRLSLAWMMGRATFPAKQYIIRQGDPGARFYVVYEGEIEVRALNAGGKKPHTGAKWLKIVPTPSASNEAKNEPAAEADDDSGAERKYQHTFGEKSLFLGTPHSAGIWTKDKTELFFIDKAQFDYVRHQNSGIEQLLEPDDVIKQGFRYADVDFDDKSLDEDVLYFSRRHWIEFVISLVRIPGMRSLRPTPSGFFPSAETVITVALILGFIGWIYSTTITSFMGSFVAVAISLIWTNVLCLSFVAIAWVVWVWVDWYNDYFVVTNKRIIRREKIVLLYEDQAQADLKNIQSVGVSKGFWGAMLGYCDLRVETAAAAGEILFERAPHPSRIHGWLTRFPVTRLFFKDKLIIYPDEIINEELSRSKGEGQVKSKQAQKQSLQNVLRSKMETSDVDPWEAAGQEKPPAAKLTKWEERRKDWNARLQTFLDAILPWRYYDIKPDPKKGVHVWRKHWFTLLYRTWDSMTGLLFFTLAAIVYFFGFHTVLYIPSFDFLNWLVVYADIIVILVYMGLLGLFWWEVADWGNDLYILTDKHVIDLEKKPLLISEKRNQAELTKIQNVYFEQNGLVNNLLNLGEVIIETAGTEPLTFRKVPRPREVQHLIFERMRAAQSKEKADAAKAQQEEFTKWFDAYHDTYVNLA